MLKLIGYYVANEADSGLEEQRKTLRLAAEATRAEVVAEFTERANKRAANGEELRKALRACKVHNASLAIASIDHLPNKFKFIVTVLLSGVDCFEAKQNGSSWYRRSVGMFAEFWR